MDRAGMPQILFTNSSLSKEGRHVDVHEKKSQRPGWSPSPLPSHAETAILCGYYGWFHVDGHLLIGMPWIHSAQDETPTTWRLPL